MTDRCVQRHPDLSHLASSELLSEQLLGVFMHIGCVCLSIFVIAVFCICPRAAVRSICMCAVSVSQSLAPARLCLVLGYVVFWSDDFKTDLSLSLVS